MRWTGGCSFWVSFCAPLQVAVLSSLIGFHSCRCFVDGEGIERKYYVKLAAVHNVQRTALLPRTQPMESHQSKVTETYVTKSSSTQCSVNNFF